jgi:hypothetical protein
MIEEIITDDGEVISSGEKDFYTKALNEIPFEEIKNYFFLKSLIQKSKENHKKTNGKCGLSIIQMKNIISFDDLEKAILFLIEKKQIIQREGINNNLYFLNTKNK